ncbi:MAG: hypothetical protein MKZ98_09220, partial [Pseudomonadales bacterium]|nr:hypothetical protein [Pseudomonadales bacterium]
LLYAGVTKTSGAIAHIRRQPVVWHPLKIMAAGISKSALLTLLIGSVPGAQVGTRKTGLLLGAVIKQIIAFLLLVVGGVTSTVALP